MSQPDVGSGLSSPASTLARDLVANDVAAEADLGRPGKSSTTTGVPAGLGTPAAGRLWWFVGLGAAALVVIVAGIVVIRLVTSPQTTHGGGGTATPSGASQVVITDNEDVFVGNASPCLGTVTLRLKWSFKNAPTGAVVLVDLSGPGLPPAITFKLPSDGTYEQDYSIQGAGMWTTHIVSINNAPPPALHATNSSSAKCA